VDSEVGVLDHAQHTEHTDREMFRADPQKPGYETSVNKAVGRTPGLQCVME
jgi:hypothetical protein